MFKFLKWKSKYREAPIPIIETDTECDMCEHLKECKPRLTDITRLENTRPHFVRGRGFDIQNCKKYMYEHYDEMESKDGRTSYHSS